MAKAKMDLRALKEELDKPPARRMAGMTVRGRESTAGRAKPKKPGFGELKEVEARQEEELREAFWRRQERKGLIAKKGRNLA